MCPFFEFSDYLNWIERKKDYATMPTKGYSSIVASISRMFQAIMCVALCLVLEDKLGFDMKLCGMKDFLTYRNFWWRNIFFIIAIFGQRFVAYAVWCFSDAAMIACGVSYNGTL